MSRRRFRRNGEEVGFRVLGAPRWRGCRIPSRECDVGRVWHLDIDLTELSGLPMVIPLSGSLQPVTFALVHLGDNGKSSWLCGQSLSGYR